ncbi:MAG: hypothetical protein JSC189_001199 [Candidatus Tokpelaia sp. JSC189]|nr:MAG: hypothetical protein JSC189_001199 [Candidatus Tokpelaia sp. JSC189]
MIILTINSSRYRMIPKLKMHEVNQSNNALYCTATGIFLLECLPLYLGAHNIDRAFSLAVSLAVDTWFVIKESAV